jgi:hypothetical protein
MNTEYVFLPEHGVPTAPCIAWRHSDTDVVRYAKAVRMLLRVPKGLPEFERLLVNCPDPPIRPR